MALMMSVSHSDKKTSSKNNENMTKIGSKRMKKRERKKLLRYPLLCVCVGGFFAHLPLRKKPCEREKFSIPTSDELVAIATRMITSTHSHEIPSLTRTHTHCRCVGY